MSLLWYATRATGLVALLFLTVVFALGMLTAVRVGGERMPRFVLAGLHRNLTLAGLGFLAVHIGTAVADAYAPIGVTDVVLPFVSAYRPVWLGLGALAFDVLLVLTVTSLLRARMGYRSWKILHWAAYACWSLLVVHALGTGSDVRTSLFWLLAGVCAAVVMVAGGWRLVAGDPAHRLRQSGAALLALVAVIAVTFWTLTGPLAPGWASRSGTPGTQAAPSQGTATSPAPYTSPRPSHTARPHTGDGDDGGDPE